MSFASVKMVVLAIASRMIANVETTTSEPSASSILARARKCAMIAVSAKPGTKPRAFVTRDGRAKTATW